MPRNFPRATSGTITREAGSTAPKKTLSRSSIADVLSIASISLESAASPRSPLLMGSSLNIRFFSSTPLTTASRSTSSLFSQR